MDGFQTVSVVLLGLLSTAHIAILVVIYRAAVRAEVRRAALQATADMTIQRLVEIEAALKGAAPSIQRSTDHAVKHLADVNSTLGSLHHSTSDGIIELKELKRELTLRLDQTTRVVDESSTSVGACVKDLQQQLSLA